MIDCSTKGKGEECSCSSLCKSLARRPKLEPARESIFLLTLLDVDYNANRWCGQRVFNMNCVQENGEFSLEIKLFPCLLRHR